jgi:hypothetical protein
MANNFASHTTSLSDATLTTVRSATSNKQILVGCLVSNTGTSSILVDVVLNDGSNDRYIIKQAPLPQGSSIELVSGKYVIPSGGSVKVKSDNSSGNADVIVSTLEDVA